MALVMLPCDLPWWSSVQKHLNKIAATKNTSDLIEGMHKIHDLCNVSLDPDEDIADPHLFIGLLNFLDNDLNNEERSNFLNKTLPNVVRRALALKEYKPKGGLHFSLQQQPDCTDLDYNFISSLIANAFFSTFPKRTDKSHPTLQNFNFSNFFKHLNEPVQKAKLKSILHYFDWLEESENSQGNMKISRQVMSSKEWLTIEDWLECSLPLCPLQIKHEGKLDRADGDTMQMCFASSKIGGKVLQDANNQESITLATFPELLSILLNVEALEDNEVVMIEGVRCISRIVDSKKKAHFERLDSTQKITVCCADAEDYSKLPITQYEEDNILRELNKCLLAFQQKQYKPTDNNTPQRTVQMHRPRRLSPIGESIGSYKSETGPNVPIITQQSCSTTKSRSASPECDNNNKLGVKRDYDKPTERKVICKEGIFNNRRGRFIVLGSSGECLPVKRKPDSSTSVCSSKESSEDEFLSAKTSLEDEESEDEDRIYNKELDTSERRCSFAQRLRDALRREASSIGTTEEDESSYAVGISVAGSGVDDHGINLRRGGSTGFILEDSTEEDIIEGSSIRERQWQKRQRSKKQSHQSSDYSFSTDYSSELEEVYEQFSKWLSDPIIETEKGTRLKRELNARELAVLQFAGSLLKRTLSESFAGVPLEEGCDTGNSCDDLTIKKSKLILNAKSLSLELAKHKHKLAAQLKYNAYLNEASKSVRVAKIVPKTPKKKVWMYVFDVVQKLEDIYVDIPLFDKKLSQISQRQNDGLKAVSTGNWGCGKSKKGEVQLKFVIQWLAASVAGVPSLIYYTCGHSNLSTLDTVCRILRDRKWTVKDLTEASLRFSLQALHQKNSDVTLFEELIGVERTID